MNADEFKKAVASYKEGCKNQLKASRHLLALLEQPVFSSLIEKPFLLRMVLEKYVDLMDDRLIPTLLVSEQEGNPGTPTPPREPDKPAQPPVSAKPATVSAPTQPPARVVSSVGGQGSLPASSDVWTAQKPPVSDILSPRPADVNKVKPTIEKVSMVEAFQGMAEEPNDALPKLAMPKPKKTVKRGAPPRSYDGIKGPANEEDTHGRRKIPRYTRRLPLRYSMLGRDTSMQRAFSRDVGARGLFIMANRPEKVGNALDIEVEMPEIGLVRIQAVVAWTKWVPQNLRTVDYSGFGVRINTATENWYRYFMQLEGDAPRPE